MLLLGGEGLVFTAQEGVVVARPVEHPATIDLEDPRGEAAEECPVVGHEQERPVPAAQEFLEPGDGVDVEMIRRLVEEEEIGAGDEGPGEEHAPLHATGERLEGALAVELHPRQDLGHGMLAPPGGIVLVVGPPRAGSLRPSGGDDLPHQADHLLRHILLQIRDDRAGSEDHLPGIGGEIATQQPHERRLAGAVAAEEADPLASFDMTLDAVEERGTTKAKVDVAERDDGHGGEPG